MSDSKDWAIVTIKVNNEIKDALEKLKIHHREPLWEVIKRLLDEYQSQERK